MNERFGAKSSPCYNAVVLRDLNAEITKCHMEVVCTLYH